MSYALVIGNAIQSEGSLPSSARRLDTDQWVLGLPDASVSLQRACGWYVVAETARPADTATLTTDRSLTLVGGVPTVTWTSRNKTAQEIADTTGITNRATLVSQADGALATNTTYIALASPSTAQNTAQIKALSQQMNKVIRLVIGKLDGTT